MATSLLLFVGALAIFATCAIYRSESANFPLDDCVTDDIDFLFLHFNSGNDYDITFQQEIVAQFIQDLQGFNLNKTNPRLMFANVMDRFTSNNLNVDFRSWRLHTSPGVGKYGFDDQDIRKQQYRNVQQTIRLKIPFIERLFFEMGAIRENSKHIAVIFLDGSGSSYEDYRSVPHIVQQQDTDIKIFVVIIVNKIEANIVYLIDTLIIDFYTCLILKHVLTLAICNKCMEGWLKFEHSDVTNSLSCYQLFHSNVPLTSFQASDKCTLENAYLSVTETISELTFLQAELPVHFKKFINFDDKMHQTFQPFSVQISIGLQRDLQNPDKRFHWFISRNIRFRPLVINNWMFGKPSGGRSNECVVWQFVLNDHCNSTGSSRNDNFNDTGSSGNNNSNDTRIMHKDWCDGWIDVDCKPQLITFTLCEVTIPRITEGKNLMKIKPARNASFSRSLAKGSFIDFRNNIVSISANIESNDFLQFLKQSDIEFPIFDCGVGEDHPRYISYMYVCDFTDHCRNRRDETFCNLQVARNYINASTVYCNGVYCCDGSCLPLRLVNDGEIDCFICGYGTDNDVHDESEIVIYSRKRNETCAFFCDNDKCVHLFQLNDGYTFCNGAEGPLDETIGKLEKVDTCYNSLGHIIWAPKCVYFITSPGFVLGCRDMSHLYNCSSFECPEGYFKCPNTYCIPQHYVLDGKSDCPIGEDENSYIISPCSGNFACWNSQICLHPDLVCDGHPDCPYIDDEVDCVVSCPQGFRCVSGTVTVSDYNAVKYNQNVPQNGTITKYMNLSGVDLYTSFYIHFPNTFNALVIICSNCNINDSTFGYFSLFWQLQHLDISYNLIKIIDGSYAKYSPSQSFRHLNLSYNRELVLVRYLQMTKLETLDLSYTGLTYIDGSFLELPNLKYLNLSFTFVTEIDKNAFDSNSILQLLDLRGLTMRNVYKGMFLGLSVREDLYTDSFVLCCPQIRGTNIPYYTCHAPHDAISSCFDLIGVKFQRVLLWMFAVLAIFGNMAVIGYRVILDRSVLRTGYGLFVTNLGISDFIMGVYMFTIAGADSYYRDIYVLFDKRWRESIACRLAGFLSTLSCEMSTLFIFWITLDRFLVMKFPFGQIKFTKLSKVIAVILSWIVGFLLALIPILFRFDIYSSNAMCLGLPLTTERLNGWEFSFGVFIVFNFGMCLVIAYGQRAIFRAMSKNRITETASGTSFRRIENVTVAKQLSLVAVSNFLFWFPVGIMGVLSLAGHYLSNDVYAWTMVIVLPINSATNPILYTIPALMARWDKFKHDNTRTLPRK